MIRRLHNRLVRFFVAASRRSSWRAYRNRRGLRRLWADERCVECWVEPGQPHTLSCPHTPVEEALAVLRRDSTPIDKAMFDAVDAHFETAPKEH